jgi:hypothetical protein
MAEQIPEAWIDQEVTVFYGPREIKQEGTLVSVSEQGLVVRSAPGDRDEGAFWYPLTSVIRLKHGGRAKRGPTKLGVRR